MNSNISEMESKIFSDIKCGLFSKAVHSLTQKINEYNQSNGDNLKRDVVNTRLHYYLLRSYCYYKLGSVEDLNQAIEDVFIAIELDNKRYHPYLLGALILSETKQWKHSLQMFEESIKIRSDLFETFVHKLFYLQFKVLSDNGFDEELSFKCAITHRCLEDCLNNIKYESKDTDSQILELLVDHKNDWLTSGSILNNLFLNCDNSKTSKNIFDKSLDDYNQRWNRPIDDFFSCGDSQTIPQTANIPNSRQKTNSFRSVATAEEYTLKDNKSLETHFRNISLNASQDSYKTDAIQKWRETTFTTDSVSKLCSFDIKPESPPKLTFAEHPLTASIDDQMTSLSLSDIPSIYLDDFSSIGSNKRQMATNLLKLRGVYVGNLKTKCNEKALKDMFRKYGTIVDFYQPFQMSYAFIHFKTHESALHMVSDWKWKRVDNICMDNKKLMVRFTASAEQMQKYNSMTSDEYKKRCNKAQECHLWRSGKRCPDGPNCAFKHISINRAIDTPPDKRKSKWKCV